MKNDIKGIIPALITPFNKDESLNKKATRQLVRKLIEEGADALYVSGSTGESLLMSIEERKDLIAEVCAEVNGVIPVVLQTGAISTAQAVDLAKFGASCKVDAISSLPPFYYKFSAKEIESYYRAIMDASSLPMIIYNIPALTGVNMLTAVPKLFEDKQVSGVKHTIASLYEMTLYKQIRNDITVYYGSDEQTAGGLLMGADGSIGSTFNYMTPLFKKLAKALKEGKNEEAIALQTEANKSITLILEKGLYNGIRYIIYKKYGIDTGVSRKPFAPLTDEGKAAIDTLFGF